MKINHEVMHGHKLDQLPWQSGVEVQTRNMHASG
jgi:hypothetical protein